MSALSTFQTTYGATFGISVRKGQMDGLSAVNKFGFKSSIGATFETIWDGSGNYTYPSSAGLVEIVCTDGTKDVDGGVGANTITIEGLDANYNKQSETITLNNPDSAGIEGISTNQYIRVFRAYVATAGSQGTNDDDITMSINGTTVAKIVAGAGQTLMSVYTIPDKTRAYLMAFRMGLEKNKETVARIIVRPYGNGFQTKEQFGSAGQPIIIEYSMPIIIPPRADIEVQMKAGATTGANAGFDLLLEAI